MASSKYKYDINIGHYVLLLEGESLQADDQTQAETNNDKTNNDENKTEDTQKQQIQPINLDSEDVVKMRQQKQNTLKMLNDELTKKRNNIIQCQQAVANAQTSNDQNTLNAAQKTLIQANKEYADKQFEIAKETNEFDNIIFQLQTKLVEGIEAAQISLPEKYRILNESNIQNAKVYLNKIFENDFQQRIKGMVDFKKGFANSNLLYGKDKGGYYAVCVDQEDMNKLTNTLIEIGYSKDDIYSVVLSQMFDRSDLVKA